ncbi:MAG: galactose-1-phosphate uridylyltransferase [Candidatus Doudnabacteria bacterium]|nr:galactose-1-phosphate uridylyltransferase [Candidatus Doudnabacteria bacterium]
MSEFRQDIVNKNWVLIAEGRGSRPDDFKKNQATPPDLPERELTCEFCPGNERLTPVEIGRYPKQGEWQIRVVPNKYEAVGHALGREYEEFYTSRPGSGDHEVVINREHNKYLALQDIAMIDLTLRVYIDRINELKKHEEIHYVHIIQNHGRQAGASIMHPHSQILAIPFLPDRLQDELLGTRRYWSAHGECVFCQMIAYELAQDERIVIDTPYFLVLAPYASKMPFEMHILPKTHRSSFQDIPAAERQALAEVMKAVFSRLNNRMLNPAYNYYFHTLPFGEKIASKSFDDRQSYHWHIVILPRVNIWAGFELGTEVYVNPMPPERAAKFFH